MESSVSGAYYMTCVLVSLMSLVGSDRLEAVGQVTDLIINGEDATIAEAPYMVSLMRGNVHICGGSLLKRDKVLTAAHCLSPSETYHVYMGIANLEDTNNPNLQIRTVLSFKKHPTGDIAILTLDTPMNLNSNVDTIKLAKKSNGLPRTQCRSHGWGKTEDGYTPQLKKGDFTVISNFYCNIILAFRFIFFQVKSHHICIQAASRSNCYGDSGSPLICEGRVTGVVSWGIRGCPPWFPNVFARVSSFKSWIKKRI